MAQSRNENVINTLSTDQYGFLEAFDEFTRTYFENTPDNNKLGLFGYINEITAHIAKGGMFHRNMLYGELALNTAMLPSTIYNIAVDEDVDIPKSVPAGATVIIDVKLSDVEKQLDESPGDYIVIDRNSFVVRMEEDEFRLPYSIILRRDNLSITAFYASIAFMDSHGTTINKEYDISNHFSKYISNPFMPLKVFFDEEEKSKYLSIRADVYNYYIEETESTIYANKLDGSLLFPVKHDNSLFEFFVMYKPDSTSDFEIIPKFSSNYAVDNEEKYCFYKIIDNSNYETYFSPNSPSFRLAINSVVKNLTYTTKGNACNYNFTGIPQASLPDSALTFRAAIYSSPFGGKDKPSLLEYKKMIFNNRRNVAYKASEDDLNTYIAEVSKTSFGDGSRVLFLKAQDDIITRMFLAYNMIMDQNGNPFPTNTADVEVGHIRFIDSTMPILYVPAKNLTPEKYQLYPVFLGDYDMNTSMLSLPELIQSYLKDEKQFIYFTPFSVNIVNGEGDNGIQVEFYNENLNDTYSISYTKLASGSTDVPVINTIGTYRNAAFTSSIETRMNVIADEPDKFKYLICYVNKNKDVIDFFAEMEYIPSENIFTHTTYIKNPTQYNEPRFKNGDIRIDESSYVWVNLEPDDDGEYYIDDSYRCIIYTLEKIDEPSLITDNKTSFDYMFTDMIGRLGDDRYSEYRVKASAECDQDFIFFTPLNDAVNSTFTAAPTVEGDVSSAIDITVDSLPLVGANLLYSQDRYDYFMTQLFKYIDIIKGIGKDLANSSSISFKFYNTYGPSKQFYIRQKSAASDNNASEPVSIGRTNLHLVLEIDREDGYDIDVDYKIKDICRVFINDINTSITNKTALNSAISFSNLTTKIEQEIPSITSCNLISINGIEFPRKIFRTNDVYNGGKRRYTNWITPEIIALDLRRKPSDMSNIEELNVETIYIS